MELFHVGGALEWLHVAPYAADARAAILHLLGQALHFRVGVADYKCLRIFNLFAAACGVNGRMTAAISSGAGDLGARAQRQAYMSIRTADLKVASQKLQKNCTGQGFKKQSKAKPGGAENTLA